MAADQANPIYEIIKKTEGCITGIKLRGIKGLYFVILRLKSETIIIKER